MESFGRRERIDDIETWRERESFFRDEPWGRPAYCPGGVRHKDGVSSVQALVRNCQPVAPTPSTGLNGRLLPSVAPVIITAQSWLQSGAQW